MLPRYDPDAAAAAIAAAPSDGDNCLNYEARCFEQEDTRTRAPICGG